MRLIDADAFDFRVGQKKMTDVFPQWGELPKEVQDAVCKYARHIHVLLENHPTIDAVEVVHGRWESVEARPHLIYECSICGDRRAYGEMLNCNFCPNCGARMW